MIGMIVFLYLTSGMMVTIFMALLYAAMRGHLKGNDLYQECRSIDIPEKLTIQNWMAIVLIVAFWPIIGTAYIICVRKEDEFKAILLED